MMMRSREQRDDRDRPEMGDSREVLIRGCSGPIIAEMKRGSAGVATERWSDACNPKREGGANCERKKERPENVGSVSDGGQSGKRDGRPLRVNYPPSFSSTPSISSPIHSFSVSSP